MNQRLLWSAHDELTSLRKHARITGCDLRELVDIPPKTRAAMELFCKTHPRDAEDVQESLDVRDWMLERL